MCIRQRNARGWPEKTLSCPTKNTRVTEYVANERHNHTHTLNRFGVFCAKLWKHYYLYENVFSIKRTTRDFFYIYLEDCIHFMKRYVMLVSLLHVARKLAKKMKRKYWVHHKLHHSKSVAVSVSNTNLRVSRLLCTVHKWIVAV